MSFGQDAASAQPSGFSRPAADSPCPCGSGATFGDCCAPVIAGRASLTAEQLMRSRYTAFAIGDHRHLMETWHPGTRPDAIDLDPQVRWVRLEVLGVQDGAAEDRRGFVEFAAHFRERGADGTLHERSRFVRQSDRWWYLDGELS